MATTANMVAKAARSGLRNDARSLIISIVNDFSRPRGAESSERRLLVLLVVDQFERCVPSAAEAAIDFKRKWATLNFDHALKLESVA